MLGGQNFQGQSSNKTHFICKVIRIVTKSRMSCRVYQILHCMWQDRDVLIFQIQCVCVYICKYTQILIDYSKNVFYRMILQVSLSFKNIFSFIEERMTILYYINVKESCLSVKVKNTLKYQEEDCQFLCVCFQVTLVHLLYFLLLKIFFLYALIFSHNQSFKVTLAYWDGK